MFTDSKCLFDSMTRLTSATEKRLLIDIAALRQSYTRGELFNLGHVSSNYNLADPLTKKTRSTLLETAMMEGKLTHPVNQWIIHNAELKRDKKVRFKGDEKDVLVKEKSVSVVNEVIHKTRLAIRLTLYGDSDSR